MQALFKRPSQEEVLPPGEQQDEQSPQPERKARQSSVQLYEDQLDWLDEKRMEARKKGGRRLRKTEFIRALIDLAMRTDVDLKGIQSEEDIAQRFEEAIKNQ
jgi:hypothetical protein